ncbi:MAG: TRAP transporter small permease [Paracoccaceae bacterium]|nr:TRAP transporter small permease [Paracoccaceae bacterium]
MINRLVTGFERLTAVLAIFSAILVLAMSAWITYDVLARNFLGVGSPWFFDLSEYTLVWVTFLAAPWVLLQDRHVRIELLVEVLPKSFQRNLGIVVSILAFLTCVVLFWKTGAAAYKYWDTNVMMPRIWRIPRIWPYVAIPVGSALLAIAFLVRLHRYVTSKDPEADFRANAMSDQVEQTEKQE